MELKNIFFFLSKMVIQLTNKKCICCSIRWNRCISQRTKETRAIGKGGKEKNRAVKKRRKS